MVEIRNVPYTMAIGLAISSDKGETFQKISDGPILGQTTKEPFCYQVLKLLSKMVYGICGI